MKVCTQCKLEKDYLDFPKRKTSKDGYYSWCKLCSRAKTLERSRKHPEKIKKYKEDNKEILLKKAREYKARNKEKLVKQQKLYYAANREKLIEKAKFYYFKNFEKNKERKKLYYEYWKTTDSAKLYNKEYRKIRKIKFKKHIYAGQKVRDALKYKKIIKQSHCTLCLSADKIEAHHPNYDEPLNVVWLCRKCHSAIHKKIKKEAICK